MSKLPKVSAIESMVKKFTGDDHLEINKCFDELEEALVVLNFDERLRLVACRRMLGGTTEAFARAHPVFVHGDLKAELVREFGRNRTLPEVYEMLTVRRLCPGESIRRYMFDMQEIAAQAAILETETIDFIIDGLGDSSSDISMLYAAKTMADLKPLIERYERKRVRSGVTSANRPSTAAQRDPFNLNGTYFTI